MAAPNHGILGSSKWGLAIGKLVKERYLSPTPPTHAARDPVGSAASTGCFSIPSPLANQNSDDNKSSPSSPYPLLLIELLLQFMRHAAEEALPSLTERVVIETYSVTHQWKDSDSNVEASSCVPWREIMMEPSFESVGGSQGNVFAS